MREKYLWVRTGTEKENEENMWRRKMSPFAGQTNK